MRAVAYIRVSTDDQAKEGVGLDAQRARVAAWCAANDAPLDPADVFVEGEVEGEGGGAGRGRSGGRADNRPALQAALGRVCACGGVLVFYSLSRLARSTRDTLAIAERLDRAGANMVSLSERIDTTSASGKMVFRMLAVLAEFERDLIRERTSDALQHKIRKGERCGKVRFGSAVDPVDPRRSRRTGSPAALVPCPAELEAVALMKEMEAEGLSLRAIAAELTRRGIPTKEGRPGWHHSSVKRILARTS
jgi:DNA invertase Pin-like site-specific DNA recombinase